MKNMFCRLFHPRGTCLRSPHHHSHNSTTTFSEPPPPPRAVKYTTYIIYKYIYIYTYCPLLILWKITVFIFVIYTTRWRRRLLSDRRITSYSDATSRAPAGGAMIKIVWHARVLCNRRIIIIRDIILYKCLCGRPTTTFTIPHRPESTRDIYLYTYYIFFFSFIILFLSNER